MLVRFCDNGNTSFERVAINSGQCLETIQLAEWSGRTFVSMFVVDDDIVACTLDNSPYVELFSLAKKCCIGSMKALKKRPREVIRLKKSIPDVLVAVMKESLVFWHTSSQLRIISTLFLEGEVTSNLCELEDGTLTLGVT